MSEELRECLSHLGAGNNGFGQQTEDYNPKLLEAFPSSYSKVGVGRNIVTLQAHKFTHLCPLTKQPDWAEVFIRYIPKEKMVESKSIKLYLNSFRNHGGFHEECIATIAKDLKELVDPYLIEVYGLFTPRGDIAIYPHVVLTDSSEQMEQVKQDLLLSQNVIQRHYGITK